MRDACYFSVLFYGLLRAAEGLSLTRSDVQFLPGGVNLTVRRSKTDQLRRGASVFIASQNAVTCPVQLVRRYMCKYAMPASAPLFSISANSCAPWLYRSALVQFRSALSDVTTHDVRRFGLHSMRAGGCTELLLRGASPIAVKRHGRWAQNSSMQMYYRPEAHEMLAVSKLFGSQLL
jgi:integrase